MRKADLEKNHDWFEEDMAWLTYYLGRMITARRVVRATDKIEIVESSIIRICALWEAFVEEELIDCLNLDCSKFSEQLKLDLPKHLNRSLCEAILIGHRYLDFKSVDDIKSLARKFLADDVNPFRLIKAPTAKKIDEVYTIRNYLSHYGGHARRRLQRMYNESYHLKKFRQPGDFLLSYQGKRLVAYIDAFLAASKQMRSLLP